MTTEIRRVTTAAAPQAGDWRRRTACTEADASLFFPTGSQQQIAVQTQKAKRICAACPARTACLEWALETRQRFGVWGGLSEDERTALLRKRTAHTRDAVVAKALKPKRPAVETVLDEYWRVEELRKAGWGRRRVAKDLGVSREALAAAEQLVAEAGSVEAALGSLAVAA